MSIIYLATLRLVYPILTPPFLAPPDAYAFFEARAMLLHLTSDIQPLVEYMRGTLKAEAPVISTLSDLDMDDHVIGGRS